MNSAKTSPRLSNTATAARILVVDDHRPARESLADILRQAGYTVDTLGSAVEALNWLPQHAVDLVITDLQMPGLSGLDFIRELSRRKHGAQVIMVTAHATVLTAVEAMRYGAFDYIEKPFAVDQIESLVARALERGRLLDAATPAALGSAGDSPVMVGTSPAMQTLRAAVSRAAPTVETVLIHGESGTGKELVARTIHSQSQRADRPLVSLNCPALSAHLLESELFGHERGAFTGADAPRTGRFELADGGTILLDEITELDLSLQAKLLRVLQEKTFERVGSSRTQKCDVRVLATTNRDLRTEVAAGRFREDLFYRLAVIPLRVPPLRERREDVPLLVDHFLKRASARLGQPTCALDNITRALLRDYHWPGNVRELENIVTRASVLGADRPITVDDVRPWLIDAPAVSTAATSATVPVGLSLQEMERQLIEATLEKFDGHRAKTAQALNIGLRTLSGKLKEYGYAPRAKRLQRSEA
ncbi:MAG: sigma-54-dependent Fis family transcriptional regulator [Planctomycetes bacterium]|nr:sigma-54-dependent Fis family transcriptional regulator [Planctomycetota bacterium]